MNIFTVYHDMLLFIMDFHIKCTWTHTQKVQRIRHTIYIYTHIFKITKNTLKALGTHIYVVFLTPMLFGPTKPFSDDSDQERRGFFTSSHEVNVNCIGLTAKANWGSDVSIGSVETLGTLQIWPVWWIQIKHIMMKHDILGYPIRDNTKAFPLRNI